MANRVELQPMFVLHRRPYRESSLLIEGFSRDHGRTGLVAKGARRPKAPLRGLLQPFIPLLASWSGRGELGTLTGAEPDGQRPPPAGDALFSAMYMNELVMRLLTRHDPHPEVFDAYAAALEELSGLGSRAPAQLAEVTLRLFEKRLLDSIGYGLVFFDENGDSLDIDPRARYAYRHERGPRLLSEGDTASAGLDVVVSGHTLVALAGERLSPECLLDAKRLMRHLLKPLLGDRPLMTRYLFTAESAARTTKRRSGLGAASRPGT